MPGVEGGKALVRRQIPQQAKRLRHRPTLILRQSAELAQRTAHLGPLLRAQLSQGLITSQQLLATLRVHRAQLRQPVEVALLRLRRQIAKPGLLLQGLLLLGQREAAMLGHPVDEVFPMRPGKLPVLGLLLRAGCGCTGSLAHRRRGTSLNRCRSLPLALL